MFLTYPHSLCKTLKDLHATGDCVTLMVTDDRKKHCRKKLFVLILRTIRTFEQLSRSDCFYFVLDDDACSVSAKTDAEAIRVALKETLRYGLFVGTFAGSFCTVDATIAAIGGGRRFVPLSSSCLSFSFSFSFAF